MLFSRKPVFNDADLDRDPWSVLYKDVPKKADRNFLWKSYDVAMKCRNEIVERIKPEIVDTKTANVLMKHHDVAMDRLREIMERLQSVKD